MTSCIKDLQETLVSRGHSVSAFAEIMSDGREHCSSAGGTPVGSLRPGTEIGLDSHWKVLQGEVWRVRATDHPTALSCFLALFTPP